MRRVPAGTDGARLDAFLWLALPTLALFWLPTGFVSNDGLGQSRLLAAGHWLLNPNHLLYEPLGAWWISFWTRGGSVREPYELLKLLSALFGGLATGLFRYRVAGRLAQTRWAANHATAWLALAGGFSRLWVSDEFQIVQMPFVVLVAWSVVHYLERCLLKRALAIGGAVGLAALAFISNVALGAALTVVLASWHWVRGDDRRVALRCAAAIGVGAALAAGPLLIWVWWMAPSSDSLLAWLTTYSGGLNSNRILEAFGLAGSGESWLEAVVRSGYGAANSLVDLRSVASAVRDREALGLQDWMALLAWVCAALVLLWGFLSACREPREPADRAALIITAAWLPAFLGFGIFWNDSADQFFVQLAPVFGVLAARLPGRGRRSPLIFALSCAALAWNLSEVIRQRVLYPRHERLALLEREIRGACLVVYPGFDEAEMLLELSAPASAPARLSLTSVATRYPGATGTAKVILAIEVCLRHSGRVVVIDVFDTPRDRSPWKLLRRLGYDHEEVERLLGRLVPAPSRKVGPFTVREADR